MRAFHRFDSKHQDIIHDLAYDFYGKRLATCSVDKTIKVWEQDEKGEWVCKAEWLAHKQGVFKISWAHPEFGQLIASCSSDTTVGLWEEKEDLNSKEWQRVATLQESRKSVEDIKFGPHHFGLKLAACSADGIVRFYDAIDVTNLASWLVYSELEKKECVKCVSWNPGPPFDKAMVVTGSRKDLSAPDRPVKAKVWEYNDQQRKWNFVLELSGHNDTINDVAWAPNMGRSYNLIATGSKDCNVRIWRLQVNKETKKLKLSKWHASASTRLRFGAWNGMLPVLY